MINLLSLAKAASPGLKYLEKFDGILLHVANYAEKLPKKALAVASTLTAVITGGCMFSSAANHQAKGGVLDIVSGLADCTVDGYSPEGGAEPGTLYTNGGKILRSAFINSFNLALSFPHILKRLSPHTKILGYVTSAFSVAEAASALDEATRGDGKRVGDKVDFFSNILSIFSLAVTRKRLLGLGVA